MPLQVDDITKKARAHKLIKLSEELEKEYFNKFIDKELYFIPEVYKDGYLIGHTGNYLQIKVKGNENLLNELVLVKIKSVDYPYCVSEIINQ